MTKPKRYWAFISYSHADQAWADWLHKALERYRLPRRLVRGRHRIEGVPPRLAPVFLDRMDLGATVDIEASITDALAESQSLIVICSPAATRSARVAQEIDSFRSLNQGRVLSLIVSGRPNAAERGVDPSEECFPVQLRRVRPADEGPNAVPLAADARPGKGGRQEALLKLIAGIVNTNLDQLRQRHLQRRRARWAISFVSLFGAMVCALGLALYAWNQRDAALAAQARLLTQAAVLRLRDLDVAGAQGIILEVLTDPDFSMQQTPGAISVFQEIRAADMELAVLPDPGRRYVRSAAYSPDGRRIVTASDDGTARVWDARTGMLLMTLAGHEGVVRSAAYSPDGTRIVTASRDRTARIWDARTGTPIATLSGHRDVVFWAAYSHDSSRIVTASTDQTARIWDAHTGSTIAVLTGHLDVVFSAAFSPDDNRVVTGSLDKTARLWDARTGATVAVLTGHDGNVFSAAYSPDGKRIVTASLDKTARVWDAFNGAPLVVLSGHGGPLESASFSPDSARIVTASDDNTARVWDANSGALLSVLSGHTGALFTATYSPDGNRIVTASQDTTARIWDASTSAPPAVLSGHRGFVYSAAYSPDGSHILTASFDRTARVWDVKTGTTLFTLVGHGGYVFKAAYSHDGTQIVTASYDRSARTWDAQTGAPLAVLTGHEGNVYSAAYSPDGMHIVTASADTTTRIWNSKTGGQLAVLSGRHGRTHAAAYSPDGTRIVTTSADNTARIWDARTGTPLIVLSGHTEPVLSAAYSPDGTRLVTSSDDKTARTWDAQTGNPLIVLSGHSSTINSAAYSPDGSRIVTASDDKTARVWDAQTGAPLAVLSGHTDGVEAAAYSPDGTHIVTSSDDRTARIWNDHNNAKIGPQIIWSESAEADPLLSSDRLQFGLSPDQREKRSPTTGSACDQAAAAYYDPDRLASGRDPAMIVGDIAVSACSQELSRSQRSLRLMYQTGRSLLAKQDREGARRLFELAVSRGHAPANVDLANLLVDPSDEVVNPDRAVSLYERAWHGGISIAAFRLGQLYERGVSGLKASRAPFPIDQSKAWSWYQRGADAGEPNALARFAERFDEGAIAETDSSRMNALLLNAFSYYAAATERARTEDWPDDAWGNWRYRRATLARLLAHEGMMQQVADAYETVLKKWPRSSRWQTFKDQLLQQRQRE